jgi:hypothetical protein
MNKKVTPKAKTTVKKAVTPKVKDSVSKELKIVSDDGVGTKIKNLLSLLGFKSCDECKNREDWLNKTFSSYMAIEMTDEELEYFNEVKDFRILNNEELNNIQKIYFNVFQINKPQPLCKSCPGVWIEVMSKLRKVYNIQTNIE